MISHAEIESLTPKDVRGGYGWYIKEDGTVVRFFSCHCDPDDPRMYEEQALLDMYEFSRPLFDPNKIETRKVRKELGDRNVVNLGMKVNKVSNKGYVSRRK